jgi:hypothetical protein
MVRSCPLHFPPTIHAPPNMMIPITKQTRVFDPKGNETYVIARQADLTSLLWTITQILSWTELTRLSRNDRTAISSIADTTPQQAQMVSYLLYFFILPLPHIMMNAMCMKIRWKLPSQTFGSVMIQMAISDIYPISTFA